MGGISSAVENGSNSSNSSKNHDSDSNADINKLQTRNLSKKEISLSVFRSKYSDC